MGGIVKRRLLRQQRQKRKSWRCRSGRPGSYYAVRSKGANWIGVGARCVGTSHKATGTPCQDAVGAIVDDNGVSVIVLADGAGSAKYSHYGAAYVVGRAAELAIEHYDEAFRTSASPNKFKRKLIEQLQIELARMATNGFVVTDSDGNGSLVKCDTRELASTLLLVAVKSNSFIAVHVGDGVIGAEVSRFGQRRLEVIGRPENGEFANETIFVTSSVAVEDSKVETGSILERHRGVEGFIVMSDGPEAALYEKRANRLAPSCSKLLRAASELDEEDMNAQLRHTLEDVISQKTSDDCSIGILVREERPIALV